MSAANGVFTVNTVLDVAVKLSDSIRCPVLNACVTEEGLTRYTFWIRADSIVGMVIVNVLLLP